MNLAKHLAIGFAATMLLLLTKMAIERTETGREVDVRTFQLLQGFLPGLTREHLPVVVADISRIPGGKDGPTPRAALRELLVAIADQAPRAIAVDIDFSPKPDGWVTDDDPAFFDFCLDLSRRKQVPIFLGVFRSFQEKADAWLGLPEYQSLAAAGLGRPADPRRLPRWVDTGDARLPTIGSALASAYLADLPQPPGWISWALERADAKHAGEAAHIVDVLVNYSKLDQIDSEHLTFTRPDTVKDLGELLRGRLLLLGDVASPMDAFTVPGRQEVVPGVYLMASVAYTIAFEPLYEFSHGARIALDGLISMIIVFGAYRIAERSGRGIKGRRRRGRFVLAMVLVVLAFGVALVRVGGIMWFDFLFAPFAILLHPRVEDFLTEKFSRRGKSRHESRT